MAIDFPASPTTNQEFTSGNTTWKYDGTKWNLKTSGATGPQGPQGPQGAVGLGSNLYLFNTYN